MTTHARTCPGGACRSVQKNASIRSCPLGLAHNDQPAARPGASQACATARWARRPTAFCGGPCTSPRSRPPRAYPRVLPRLASSAGVSPRGGHACPAGEAPAGDRAPHPSTGARPWSPGSSRRPRPARPPQSRYQRPTPRGSPGSQRRACRLICRTPSMPVCVSLLRGFLGGPAPRGENR